MSTNRPDVQRLQRALATTVHEHWMLFLLEGLLLVALGIAAVIVPNVATIAIEVMLGWLFLVSGIAGLITTFWMRHAAGFWWALLSAALAIVAGMILLKWPLRGVLSLTIVLIAYFLIDGVSSIMYALEHKRENSGRWGWMLMNGIVDIILAGMIFSGFPSVAAWAIGLLVGIDLLFGGTALIAMALHARQADPGGPST